MKLFRLKNEKIKLDERFFLRSLGVVLGIKHPCQWYLPEWNLLLESKDCGDVAKIFFQVRKYAKLLKRLETLKPVFEKVEKCDNLSIYLDDFKFDALSQPVDTPAYGDGFLCIEQFVVPIRNWRIVATEEEWLGVVNDTLDKILKKLDEIEIELYAKYTV